MTRGPALRAAALAAAVAACAGAAAARGAAGAEEPPGPSAPSATARFDALVAEIDRLRSALEGIEGREKGVLGRLERLDMQAALGAREMDRLSLLREQAQIERGAVEERVRAVEEIARSHQEDLAKNLRETYMSGRGRELRLLIWSEDPAGLLRGLAYLDVLTRRRGEALASLRQSRGSLAVMERTIQDQSASIEELAGKERDQAVELEGVRSEAAALLRSIREEASVHRTAIEELTRAAEEMEKAIVAGLRGAAPAGPVPVDFGALKGALEWPIEGAVSVPYGNIRNKAFGTVTPHPGIDIEVAPRGEVAAVAGGTVVFSRRFSGYGNTVLVDHGGGYLSVYARLGPPRVAEGDEVLPRQVLGLAADEHSGGPPLIYFELRKDGKTVDPAGWLKRKKADRRRGGR